MALERTREAIMNLRVALHKLQAAWDEPENFLNQFRNCLIDLMAIGPVMNDETPRAPKEDPAWWESRLAPDRTHLMALREKALKHGEQVLDPDFQPVSAIEAAQRMRGKVAYGKGVTHHLPNWKIKSGPYSGRNPLAALTEYLNRLEALLPEAEKYV